MLDELKEYDEYTNPVLILSSASRLKAETIKDGCSGVYRAYETIARRFFFDEMLRHKELSERVFCTKQALLSWNGFSFCEGCKCPVKKEYGAFFALLPMRLLNLVFEDNNVNGEEAEIIHNYYETLKNGSPIKAPLAEISTASKPYSAFLKQYNEKKFLHSDFPALKLSEEGNYDKVITADKVTANAAAKGELKVYYLVCNKQKYNEFLKQIKTSREKILKLIAACLLNQTEGEQSVYVNNSDVVNWFNQGRIYGNTTIPKYFTTDTTHGIKNMAKYIPNDDIKNIGFFIVEEKDIKDYQNSNYVIYKDDGIRDKIKP